MVKLKMFKIYSFIWKYHKFYLEISQVIGEIGIFITENKIYCNGTTKKIHKFRCEL